MNFTVMFVDDKRLALKHAKKAIDEFNSQLVADRTANSRTMVFKEAVSVEEFNERLSADIDLIVTDVHFKDGTGDEPRRLHDIINIVEDFRSRMQQPDRLPIIAYTDKGPDTLEYCLTFRERLLDIWDKATSSYEYLVWRISKIALEISQQRPNAILQQMVSEMNSPVAWHRHVVRMVEEYDRGWNEADQISRAGNSILQIADELGVYESCQRFWRIMEQWEVLSRAVSSNARGHARHVINVFWLGYLILHADDLRDTFIKSWKHVGVRTDAPETSDPIESLANIWFYAALFHDSGQFIEKQNQIGTTVKGILDEFSISATGAWKPDDNVKVTGAFESELGELVGEMHPISKVFEPLWRKSVEQKAIDHGLVAAINVRLELRKNHDASQVRYGCEASRAMAIHNLIGDVDVPVKGLDWTHEPIACLLVLCDQLQSWDRERGDQKSKDDDRPDRAEFTAFRIEARGDVVTMGGSINYLAPTRLNHSPEHFSKTKSFMEKVLKDFPKKALRRIDEPWPFELGFDCWLNDIPLDTRLTR